MGSREPHPQSFLSCPEPGWDWRLLPGVLEERDTCIETRTKTHRDRACAACCKETAAREPIGCPLGLGQVPQQ